MSPARRSVAGVVLIVMLATLAQRWTTARATDAEPAEITVKTGEWFYDPGELKLSPSSAVTVTLRHGGSEMTPHDIVFELDDGRRVASARITGGESDSVGFMTPAMSGSYVFYCSVDDHRSRGMEGRLVIDAAADDTPSPGTTATEDVPTATATMTAPPTHTLSTEDLVAYLPRVLRDPSPIPTASPTASNTPAPSLTPAPSTLTARPPATATNTPARPTTFPGPYPAP